MLQRKCPLFSSLALALLSTIFGATVAHAQVRYETELAKAEQKYNEGFFDQVIALIDSCLNQGDLNTAEQAWAYKLLGQAYVSKNQPKSAKIYVQKLLAVAPDYNPDREQDLQNWIELVEETKQERVQQIQEQEPPKPPKDKSAVHATSRKGGGKKWLWIGGGGAVVAGTAAFLIFRSEETRQRLPDPPTLPPVRK